MSEQSSQKEEHDTRTHVLYLVGLLLLGFILFSIAAYAGLALATKRSAEEERGASTTSETSTSAEAASKPGSAN